MNGEGLFKGDGPIAFLSIPWQSASISNNSHLPGVSLSRLYVPLGALEAFAEAGHQESFKKAAENLSLTTSAVSQSVKKLEERLGCALFTRAGNRVKLTAEGAKLLSYVELGMEQMRLGIEEIRFRPESPLAISSPPGIGGALLPNVMLQLLQSPEIDIRYVSIEDHADTSFRNYDVSIVYGNPASQRYDLQSLGPDVFLPVARPDIAQNITSFEALFAAKLLVNETSPVSWQEWGDHNRIAWPEVKKLRFNRYLHIASALLNGMGVALESLRLVDPLLRNGSLQICPIHNCIPISRELTFLFITGDEGRRLRAQEIADVVIEHCATDSQGYLLKNPVRTLLSDQN